MEAHGKTTGLALPGIAPSGSVPFNNPLYQLPPSRQTNLGWVRPTDSLFYHACQSSFAARWRSLPAHSFYGEPAGQDARDMPSCRRSRNQSSLPLYPYIQDTLNQWGIVKVGFLTTGLGSLPCWGGTVASCSLTWPGFVGWFLLKPLSRPPKLRIPSKHRASLLGAGGKPCVICWHWPPPRC